MYDLHTLVRLADEEGLDIPEKHLGQLGEVVAIYEWYKKPEKSYDVKMSNGDVVYCEAYRIDAEISKEVHPKLYELFGLL